MSYLTDELMGKIGNLNLIEREEFIQDFCEKYECRSPGNYATDKEEREFIEKELDNKRETINTLSQYANELEERSDEINALISEIKKELPPDDNMDTL